MERVWFGPGTRGPGLQQVDAGQVWKEALFLKAQAVESTQLLFSPPHPRRCPGHLLWGTTDTMETLSSALWNSLQSAAPRWAFQEGQKPGVGLKCKTDVYCFIQSEFKQR